MYKCILWGMGQEFHKCINGIKYQELSNDIMVVGVTSDNTKFKEYFGYKYVCKENLHTIDYDIVIVMGERKTYFDVVKEAIELGISEEKIIPYRILAKPGVSLEKYMNLKKNPPTIFANNCWGGITYYYLFLEFCSPLVNMFQSDNDYIKFLLRPQHYMEQPLYLKEYRYGVVLDRDYPVCSCDDINLYFNHYESFEDAVSCWERRKKRINWDNLFVMMYTEDEEIARVFSELPYKKKICFVPFESNGDGICSLSFRNRSEWKDIPFWEIVNSMANEKLLYYDAVELIHDGKIKKLCEI